MSEPVRRVVRVRCPLARAFEIFTARIDAWWPPGHRRFTDSRLVLEGRVGGRFVERDAGGEEALLGEVVAWEPPLRVAYTWYPGADTGPTRVEVCFVDEGTATRVEVEHHEGEAALGEDWRTRAERFARAWDHVLPAFAGAIDALESTTSSTGERVAGVTERESEHGEEA